MDLKIKERFGAIGVYLLNICGLVLIVFLISLALPYCSEPEDEYGILGFGKDARIGLVELLDKTEPELTVDWRDQFTTILVVRAKSQGTTQLQREGVNKMLAQPFKAITSRFPATIPNNAKTQISKETFEAKLMDKGVQTYEDMLGALGFTRIETYENATLIFGRDLKQRQGNAKQFGLGR